MTLGHIFLNCEWTLKSTFIGIHVLYIQTGYSILGVCKKSVWELFVSYWKRTAFCLKNYGSVKGSSTWCVCYVPSDLKKGRKSTEAWMVHNTTLNSSMGIDITTYQLGIGRSGPGRGYISTGIAEIYSSSTTGPDIHYRMLVTMVLLTFLLECCVMIQKEGIMQDVYMFAGQLHIQLYM